MGVVGEGRRGKGKKGGGAEKMYSSIKTIKKKEGKSWEQHNGFPKDVSLAIPTRHLISTSNTEGKGLMYL